MGWYIKHFDESDTLTDEFKALNCSFTFRDRESGDIQYDVSLSYERMRWAFAGPKRTTFELWNDDYPDRPIFNGIHSNVNTKRGEEVLHVSGKTWIWYWQNRHYPFNPQDANAFLGGTAANDQGLAYQRFGDPLDIISDLWDIIKVRPHGNEFGITFPAIVPVGLDIGFRVELGDQRSLFDMVNDMSQIDPGFTFYDNVAKEVIIVSPDLYNNDASTNPLSSIYIFDRNQSPSKLIDIEFENNGPLGTHILGFGAGTGKRFGRAYGYEQSQAQFGRWDMITEFPDTISEPKLVGLTQRAFSKGLYPQRGLSITVNADEIPGFWTLFNHAGWSVWIVDDYESNHSRNAYRIDELTGHISNTGDATAEMTLSEINTLGRPGTVQG